MTWSKVKSSFVKGVLWKISRGKLPSEHQTSVRSKPNFNEEYMEALRTKSYTDIWWKVQGQLGRTTSTTTGQLGRTTSTTTGRLSLSPLATSHLHHPDYILEPRQETIFATVAASNLHALVRDYFDGSLQACNICCLLLHCIDQTRANHSIIQRVLKVAKRRPATGDYTQEQCLFISSQLTVFADLENPLSGSTQMQFHQIHELYVSMVRDLVFARKKVVRRARMQGICKKAARVGLTVACGMLLIITLAVAAHTLFGLLAMPLLFCPSTPFLKRRIQSRRCLMRSSKCLKRVGAQLDAAAKGAYILGRDFDTMSRLATRLHDEIEHNKAVIGICLSNGRGQLLVEEVVKELRSNEAGFLEQLEELEEHVYLCFLTINRARRLVFQEIVMQQHQK
ncbi:hypothetical protein ACLOJK_041819 [Asimina triloba]